MAPKAPLMNIGREKYVRNAAGEITLRTIKTARRKYAVKPSKRERTDALSFPSNVAKFLLPPLLSASISGISFIRSMFDIIIPGIIPSNNGIEENLPVITIYVPRTDRGPRLRPVNTSPRSEERRVGKE